MVVKDAPPQTTVVETPPVAGGEQTVRTDTPPGAGGEQTIRTDTPPGAMVGLAGAASAAPASSGTPDAPLIVPTTRPTAAAPTPPASTAAAGQLPFTKRQLMIGGGGLLGLVLIIAIAAGSGSGKKPAPAHTAGSGSGSAAVIDMDGDKGDGSDVVTRASALLASEDYEGAVKILRPARKAHPDNAEIAFLAGKAYFGQLWWSDGVDSFRAAVKLDPSYKTNPDMLKAVLKGFLTTPDTDDRIVDFMRHDIGPPMRPYLEETAQKHPKKALRARATAELNAE
jgi:hypothetical protein